MKTVFSLILLVLLIILSPTNGYAQKFCCSDKVSGIAHNEMRSAERLLKPEKSMLVNNYDLKYHRFYWFADPAQNYIRGIVTSYFVPTQPMMSSIQFELSSELSADSAMHKGFKYNVLHNGNIITINFGEFIPQGQLDSLTVYYHGVPTGSGFGSFVTGNHNGSPYLFTLSEPYGASDWWPSKDDLVDKIDSLDIYVVTPNGNHVASNGVLVSESPFGANFTLAHWKHRYPIASYLIAIATTNYARFTDYYVNGNDSLPIENYVYPEDSAALRAGAATAIPSMGVYENLFTPYPFWHEKYGQAEFGWGGGMEHQTMTFLGRDAFDHWVVSHELAHHWFGDMITCGSWQDIWLNEGFATYCTGLTYEHLFGGSFWHDWKLDAINKVTSLPGGSVFCDDTNTLYRIFDSRLSYNKGALLLHMLRFVVGDEAFFAGINNYLNDPRLRYGFALTNDLKTHLELTSGKDLTEFFNDWYYGQGYPIYTIDAGYGANQTLSVTIFQSQSHESVSFFEMPVPIRFMGDNRDTVLVFNNTSSGQVFNPLLDFVVTGIEFDPDLWLVSANSETTFGIDESFAANRLILVPNPANEKLTVNYDAEKLLSVRILTPEGKLQPVRPSVSRNKSLEFQTADIASGIYLLEIITEKGKSVSKFIIRH